MATLKKPCRWVTVPTIFLIALVLHLYPQGQAQAEDGFPQPIPESGSNESCLSCHSNPDLELTLPSGESLSLTISEDALQQSIHQQLGIDCRGCHPEIDGYPHPEIDYSNHRELSRSLFMACQVCHAVNYDKTLDSMHGQIAAKGNLDAPICTDCHGTHDIRPPDQPRSLISGTCGQCHTTIVDNYKDSVHGAALIMEDNQDVPVCTDCHGVHNIHDPHLWQNMGSQRGSTIFIVSPGMAWTFPYIRQIGLPFGMKARSVRIVMGSIIFLKPKIPIQP